MKTVYFSFLVKKWPREYFLGFSQPKYLIWDIFLLITQYCFIFVYILYKWDELSLQRLFTSFPGLSCVSRWSANWFLQKKCLSRVENSSLVLKRKIVLFFPRLTLAMKYLSLESISFTTKEICVFTYHPLGLYYTAQREGKTLFWIIDKWQRLFMRNPCIRLPLMYAGFRIWPLQEGLSFVCLF